MMTNGPKMEKKNLSMINSSKNAKIKSKENGYKANGLMATNRRISRWSQYINNSRRVGEERWWEEEEIAVLYCIGLSPPVSNMNRR